MVKRAKPGDTSARSKPSVSVIGGRGRRPSTMRLRNSSPLMSFRSVNGGTPMLEPASGMVAVLSFRLALRAGGLRPLRPGGRLLQLSFRALDGEAERQRGGVLDLLHGESGGHLGDFDAGDELLVEGVVGADVGHHHAQEIVDLAAHAVE